MELEKMNVKQSIKTNLIFFRFSTLLLLHLPILLPVNEDGYSCYYYGCLESYMSDNKHNMLYYSFLDNHNETFYFLLTYTFKSFHMHYSLNPKNMFLPSPPRIFCYIMIEWKGRWERTFPKYLWMQIWYIMVLLPMVKLGALFVRHISRPFSRKVVNLAKDHPVLRNYFLIPPAQCEFYTN